MAAAVGNKTALPEAPAPREPPEALPGPEAAPVPPARPHQPSPGCISSARRSLAAPGRHFRRPSAERPMRRGRGSPGVGAGPGSANEAVPRAGGGGAGRGACAVKMAAGERSAACSAARPRRPLCPVAAFCLFYFQFFCLLIPGRGGGTHTDIQRLGWPGGGAGGGPRGWAPWGGARGAGSQEGAAEVGAGPQRVREDP